MSVTAADLPGSCARRDFPWRLVAVLFCSYLVACVDRGLLSVAAAPVARDLGLSDARLGVLLGPAFVASFCLCGIPMGWLGDRWSHRRVLALGMLLWSLMTALCAVAGSFTSFLFARLGVGLGEACLVPAAVALIAQRTPDGSLARALAIFLMGAICGNAAALLGGGHVLEIIGGGAAAGIGLPSLAPWRILFLLASLPGPVLALAILCFEEPARTVLPGPLWPSLRRVLRNLARSKASYGPLSIATACIVALAQVPAAWAPLYYVRTFDMPAGKAALLVGLVYLGTAPIAQWTGGVLLDRLRDAGSADAPLRLQALCAIACWPLAVIFCSSHRLAWCEGALAAYSLVVFTATPAGLTGWRLLTPEGGMGSTIALLMSAVTFFSIGLGTATVGMVNDFWFQRENALGSSLLLVITSAALIGSWSALTGRAAFANDVR